MKVCKDCKRELPGTLEYFDKHSQTSDGLRQPCRECRGEAFRIGLMVEVKLGYKICSQCRRELPATLEHFHKNSSNREGLGQPCIECKGYAFRKIASPGYKICCKCKRELPADAVHFFRKRVHRDGLRYECKECGGGRFYSMPIPKLGRRICSICKEDLPASLEYFYTAPCKIDGLGPVCKKCQLVRAKEKRIENNEEIKRRERECYNSLSFKAKQEWRERKNELRARRKETVNRKAREKSKTSESRQRACDYVKRRREKSPAVRLSHTISTGMRRSLKNGKNGYHWESLVSYTLDDLIKHLELLFQRGMSWDNMGRDGWHVEHKIPISAFNFIKSGDIDFKKCWALKNLQPMWAEQNFSKHTKLERPFQPSLAMEI